VKLFYREIDQVLFTGTGRGGEALAAVVCRDASYGITRDGQLIDGFHWPPSDLDGCISAFMELVNLPPLSPTAPQTQA